MPRSPPDDRTRVDDAVKLGQAIGWGPAAQLLAYEFELPRRMVPEIARRLERHRASSTRPKGSGERFTTATIAAWLADAPKRVRRR
jgi:hypothetical protein